MSGMKKLSLLAINALIGAASLVPSQANATVYLDESFSYNAGNLYNQGSWLHHGKNENEPIQLVTPALTYPDYQAEATGFSAKLIGTDLTSAHERLQKQFADEGITQGSVYAAALINVQKCATGGDVYFFTICQRGAKTDAGIIDTKSGSEYPRLFCSPASSNGKFILGVSINGASATAKSDELDLNTTYLIVLKYTFVDGAKNDTIELFINPAKGNEPAQADLSVTATGAEPNATMGLQGITLRQGSASTKVGPDVLIDAIRVTDSWADLWQDGGSVDPDPDPEPEPGNGVITPAETSIELGTFYQYMKYTTTVNIKAQDLTDDITVSVSGSELKLGTSVIPAEEATSATGYNLEITYTAGPADLNETITLSSPGAEDATISVIASAYPATAFANFRQLSSFSADQICYFQGKATISYVDNSGYTPVIYAQDLYGGGAKLSTEMFLGENNLKIGDRITNFYCMMGEPSMGIPTVYLADYPAITVTEGYTVEPAEITLSELARDPESYLNRLIKVTDIDFGTAAGTKFATSGAAVTSGTASGRIRPFAGTDLIGTDIPAKATSVIGISTSASAAIISVRALADIEADNTPVGEPSIEVEKELLIDAAQWCPINTPVQFAKFTVTAKNLTQPATVYHAGKNRDQFSINVEEIPAGDSQTEIIVTYLPTTTGIHSGSLTIDAVPTELSQSFSFNARAYDPDNLPEITVNSADLTEFATTVNNPVTQTITYSTKGLLDYGSIKVVGGDGAFRISSGTMLKDCSDIALTITFAPLKAGTFSASVEFSAEMAETRVITLTGVASGEAPVEEKQGDEFTMASFDTSNAQALVIEDFQNCGESNKPLHIDGWTNAAITGTRAWWAYTDINDPEQRMAKITAYDSKAAESSLCQMLLLSPCLDYINAKQQLLTFRIMGKNMLDTQVDNLQVLYIDPATDQTTTLDLTPASSPLDEVYAEPINGLDIPASADYNGEWRDYVLDLKGLDLADKFFIGFGFASMRGHDSSTMYFIDDFSWGRDDIPFIRLDQPYLDMEAVVNTSATSRSISVEGLNLSGPISLSVTGANASKFTVEPQTLPAQGGTFTVSFSSDTKGVHACYIKLSSDGAPDSYLSVEANNAEYDAINGISAPDSSELVDVYNLQGIRIKKQITVAEAMKQLPAGLYIMGNKKVYVK